MLGFFVRLLAVVVLAIVGWGEARADALVDKFAAQIPDSTVQATMTFALKNIQDANRTSLCADHAEGAEAAAHFHRRWESGHGARHDLGARGELRSRLEDAQLLANGGLPP